MKCWIYIHFTGVWNITWQLRIAKQILPNPKNWVIFQNQKIILTFQESKFWLRELIIFLKLTQKNMQWMLKNWILVE